MDLDFTADDLDLLAYDIADMLGRNDYPLDVADDDIRPYLPMFLERITGGPNPAAVEVDLPTAVPGEDPANGNSGEVRASGGEHR